MSWQFWLPTAFAACSSQAFSFQWALLTNQIHKDCVEGNIDRIPREESRSYCVNQMYKLLTVRSFWGPSSCLPSLSPVLSIWCVFVGRTMRELHCGLGGGQWYSLIDGCFVGSLHDLGTSGVRPLSRRDQEVLACLESASNVKIAEPWSVTVEWMQKNPKGWIQA